MAFILSKRSLLIIAVLALGLFSVFFIMAKAQTEEGFYGLTAKGFYPGLEICANAKECAKACAADPGACVKFYSFISSATGALTYPLSLEMARDANKRITNAIGIMEREGGLNGCGTEKECQNVCFNKNSTIKPECDNYTLGGVRFYRYTNTALLKYWQRITGALVFALQNNIPPPPEAANGSGYTIWILSCEGIITSSPDPVTGWCVKFMTDIGYYSNEDIERANKIREISYTRNSGGRATGFTEDGMVCGGPLLGCFFNFYGPCAKAKNPVACFAVMEKYDLLPADYLTIAQKATPFFRSRETPGGCSYLEECKSYCENESHFNECAEFAEKADLGTGPSETDELTLAIQNGEAPGGCTDEDACTKYCEEASNIYECVEFFDKFDLLPPDTLQMLYDLIATCEQETDFEACIESGAGGTGEPIDPGAGIQVGIDTSKTAQKVKDAIQKGDSPGGCKSEASCRNYCEDIDNLEECVNFVEKFNLVSSDELKEMRQMVSVKKAGVAFPGNCKTKESCLAYCENSANAVQCMEFALKAGFIPKEDVESVGKIIPYLKSGGKLPGGCTTKESCDAYCGSDGHVNECMDFAVKAGFMTEEDAEIVKKTGGKGPGNCKSREACDNYCKDETHIDECVDFAVKAGFISQEDAEMAKKFKITSGPGGCKNKADCEAFCVVNQDTCFEWAKEHGMLSEEDLKNIEQQKEFMGSLDKAPPEWLACMEKELGSEFFGRFKAGKITHEEATSPALEAAQRKCESGMGQDIRKEIEACLSKATCAEFNSCFDALPKGNQQSSGEEPPQDENGKKIQARALVCMEEKMDACLALSCSEFQACLQSFQQGSGDQGTGDQQPGQSQENPKFNAKMQACQDEIKAIQMKEIQEKMAACLTRSCSEFESCLKSVQPSGDQGGEQDGQQQEQGTPDPAVGAKIRVCQQEKINACLAKPCGEFQACLNALGGGDGGGEQGAPDPAVQAKFMSCFPPPPQGGQSSSLWRALLGNILTLWQKAVKL